MAARNKKAQGTGSKVQEKKEEEKAGVRLETSVEAAEPVVAVGQEHIDKMLQVAGSATVGDLARANVETVEAPVAAVPPVVVPDSSTIAAAEAAVAVAEPVQVENPVESGRSWTWLWVAASFVLGAAIGGLLGWWVWGSGGFAWLGKTVGMKTARTLVDKTGGEKAGPTAQPTQAPVLSRKDLKLRVLNGSGARGAAATAADYLKSLGYTIESVGNAEGENYAQTTIELTAGFEAYQEMLRADLGAKYKVDSKSGKVVGEPGYDGVVIVGIE